MYKIKSLTLENFASFDEAEINIPGNVCLLVGDNQTDEGQDSNGSGKSFLIEGICYALTGQSFRKITDSEIVREGETIASVKIVLENKVQNQEVKIERNIYLKKSNQVRIFINGIEKSTLTSVNEANKFILDLLGLNKDDLMNYFLISKEKYTSFFNSPDTAKKALISRFSKADMIDPIINEKLPNEIKSFENSLTELERQISKQQGIVEALQDYNYEEALVEFEEKKKIKIETISKKINTLINDLEHYEHLSSEIPKKIEQVEFELEKIPSTTELREKYKQKGDDIKTLNNALKELKSQSREIDKLYSEVEKTLAGVITCPKCNWRFTLENQDVEEAEESKKDLLTLSEEIVQSIELKSEEITELERIQSQINSEIKAVEIKESEIEIKLRRLKLNKKDADNSISEIESKLKRLDSELKEEEALEYETENNEVKIKAAKKEIEAITKKKENIVLEVQGKKELLLTFKSFKNFLSNKSLKTITSFTNIYLEKLGSSLRVQFDGFKELKSGAVREKIDCRVFKFGEEKGSYGKLSGGEKARVEVATILALSAIINSSTEGSGLDFVAIDEVLESLDQTGLYSVLKALNELNQSVMLVTHGKLLDKQDFDILTIRKTNGISRVL